MSVNKPGVRLYFEPDYGEPPVAKPRWKIAGRVPRPGGYRYCWVSAEPNAHTGLPDRIETDVTWFWGEEHTPPALMFLSEEDENLVMERSRSHRERNHRQ